MPIKDDRNLLLFCIKREAGGLGKFLLGSQLAEQSRISEFCGSYYAMHSEVPHLDLELPGCGLL